MASNYDEYRKIRKELIGLKSAAKQRIRRSEQAGYINILSTYNFPQNPPTLGEFRDYTEKEQRQAINDYRDAITALKNEMKSPLSSLIGVKSQIEKETSINPYSSNLNKAQQTILASSRFLITNAEAAMQKEKRTLEGHLFRMKQGMEVSDLFDEIDSWDVDENLKNTMKKFLHHKLEQDTPDYDTNYIGLTLEEILNNPQAFLDDFKELYAAEAKLLEEYMESFNIEDFDNPTSVM